MTGIRLARLIAGACVLLAAGGVAEAASIQTFHAVTVSPAYVSAKPGAIAKKYCVTRGFEGRRLPLHRLQFRQRNRIGAFR